MSVAYQALTCQVLPTALQRAQCLQPLGVTGYAISTAAGTISEGQIPSNAPIGLRFSRR
jgi:hypothetical protein